MRVPSGGGYSNRPVSIPLSRTLTTSAHARTPTVPVPVPVPVPLPVPVPTTARRRCTCNKSRCLKLYCVCFAHGMTCSSDCSCDECCNTESAVQNRCSVRATAIANAIRKNRTFAAILRHRTAVQAATHETETETGATTTPLQNTTTVPPVAEYLAGCHCQKSGCIKKYCPCFQRGLRCGSHCRCCSCCNKLSGSTYRLIRSIRSVPTLTRMFVRYRTKSPPRSHMRPPQRSSNFFPWPPRQGSCKARVSCTGVFGRLPMKRGCTRS